MPKFSSLLGTYILRCQHFKTDSARCVNGRICKSEVSIAYNTVIVNNEKKEEENYTTLKDIYSIKEYL